MSHPGHPGRAFATPPGLPCRMPDMIPLARRLAAAIEPVAGQAQFSPECHANYEALGFAPSPGMVGRTALPDKGGFFTSRGAVLGDVPAEVVAAVFAVFNPDEIVPIVRQGKTLANASTMWAARLDGAVAQLRRILGPEPARAVWVADRLLRAADDLPLAGRALFAAQRAAEIPDEPIARLWRAADRLREYRGDSHVQAWSAAGFDPVAIGLLGDLYWGLAPRAHTRGRGWTDEQLATGEERLRARGLLDGDAITHQGREVREAIETSTDAAMAGALAVLGDDLEEILATMEPWGAAIRDAGGYLTPLVRFTFANT